ncbi:MAG: DUF1622 domain-containing protein [Planctomycetota bacterium]|nr:DUF1622 domain-containing protein [Planctomycetota bacterium]
MPEWMHEALHVIVSGLEIVGASALILGFLIATVRFVGQVKSLGVADAREGYRRSLGRVVLVGLEILVAATIIKTITIEPTPASLGLLAMMIAIRTFLGWTMVLEMDGRWPWQ